LGVLIVVGEMGAGGGPFQLRKLFVVAAVFIALESAGVLTGYALLARPLGLFRPASPKA
jgi:hypothetical protein